jgi:hypothetical protein
MKKFFLFLSILALLSLACNLTLSADTSTAPTSQPANTALPADNIPTQVSATVIALATQNPPTQTTLPATVRPETSNTPQHPVNRETVLTFGKLTLSIPTEVAIGASGSEHPRFDGENTPMWQKTPGHTQILLSDTYPLKGTSQQPQIYVYPAQAYAELNPAAFESIRRVNNIIYGTDTPKINQLSAIPFINAKQLFTANIQVLSFKNGNGVRFLTEYAQYPASANNQDLFYNFHGVTRDGAYYIVAIFPVSCVVLAETSDGGAALPVGGIPYPYFANPKADMTSYYHSVSDLLNAQTPEAFTPNLNQLDALIQSMQAAP